MSNTYGRNIERNSTTRHSGNLQQKREKEKIRRQQQSATQEAVKKPVFLEPRKIPARQDSLTRNITNVLGDPGVVSEILFREPTIYLGTSRSSQGQTATQEESHLASLSATMPKGVTQHIHSRQAHKGKDGSLNHLSEDRVMERRHTSKSKFSRLVGQEQAGQGHCLHGEQQGSSLKSENVHISPNQRPEFSGTHVYRNEDTFSALKRASRDRVPSGDSDMGFGVENILKEMVVDLSPSITGIKTPSVNESKFNFTPSGQKKKLDGLENSLESTYSDPTDCNAGSDDSSGDDSSDDDTNGNISNPDEDNNAKSTGWNLGDLMPPNTNIKSVKDDPNAEKSETRSHEKATKRRNSSNSQSQKLISRGLVHETRSRSSTDPLCNSPPLPHGSDAIDTRYKLKSPKHGGLKAAKDVDLARKKPAHRTNKHHHSKMPRSNVSSKESEQNPNRFSTREHQTSTSINSKSPSSDLNSSDNEDSSECESSDSQEYSIESNRESVRQRLTNSRKDSISQLSQRNDNWVNSSNSVRSKYVRRNPASSTSGDKMSSYNNNSHSYAINNFATKQSVARHSAQKNLYPSLYVKLKSSLFDDELRNLPSGPIKNEVDHVVPHKRQTAMSTGSETDQPVRRTTCVQVAVADGSTDWKKEQAPSIRKFASSETEQLHSPKRPRRVKSIQKQDNQTFANEGSRVSVETKYRHNPPVLDSNTNASSSSRGQNNSNFNQKLSVTPALPDSSVTGEQERIQTSDWYMREGKKKKHEGDDGMEDSRSDRTRAGEAIIRALSSYFEASLYFIMSGFVMESENREVSDRLETGSNNSSSSYSHCPVYMYQETLRFLDSVLKMLLRAGQDDKTLQRITLSCIRCQAFVYFRIARLKKDEALKYCEVLTDQFKTVDKSVQTHSPWHSTNVPPNVVSPMSPAVPSPYTHHGPSPASNNGEQVSSSTQAGKMTPTSHSSYSFSQKTYEMYCQNHTFLCKAHEKWDQAESMLEEHANFFHNIDALCNRTLTFHSCLQEVFIYNKMVLRQLRALMNGSPST